MGNVILTVIALAFSMIIGLWKYFGRKNEYNRKQAEQAKKDMENAKTKDSPSDFLDSFGRVNR